MDAPAEFRPALPEVDTDERTRMQVLDIFSEVSANLADEDDVEELLGRFLGTMLRLAKASAGAVRVVTTDLGDKGKWYRVLVGPYASAEAAKRTREKMLTRGSVTEE